MIYKSNFSYKYFYPRYWLTWSGLFFLWSLVKLPYPVLVRIGIWSGKRSRIFLQRRERIARRNISLCFPDISESDKEELIQKIFCSLGLALMETGMAWFWSDKRLREWFDVEGINNLQKAQQNRRGVLAIGVHFMSVELGGRIMGLCQPMIAVYRPHNNALMEWVQTRGRMRSNKRMIDRRHLSDIVNSLKKGEVVWFAPDQDYGPKGSSFVPFFAVPDAATTNGTFVLARLSGAALLTISMVRNADYDGYTLFISPELTDYPRKNAIESASWINKIIEKEIMRSPGQYLWIHRRFKTRPGGEKSLYI